MNELFKDQVKQSDIRLAKQKINQEIKDVLWAVKMTLLAIGALAATQTVFEALL